MPASSRALCRAFLVDHRHLAVHLAARHAARLAVRHRRVVHPVVRPAAEVVVHLVDRNERCRMHGVARSQVRASGRVSTHARVRILLLARNG